MHDPFPFQAPSALASLVAKPSEYIALPTIPVHIHEILLAAAAYHVTCFVVSPIISKAIFPKAYNSFDKRTKLNWDVHVTSLFQSTMINVLAFWILLYDDERNAMDWRDRVYGYDGALGLIASLAAGYFLWDLWLCAWYVKVFGVGLLAHAGSALAVYALGFRPLVMYYAPVFILFELSSPFLNFHWFFDKLNMTGSNAQLFNGIILMTTFAGSRLIWGTYNCFRVFPDMIKALQYQSTIDGQFWLAESQANATAKAVADRATSGSDMSPESHIFGSTAPRRLPEWVALVYVISYLTLMALNFVWFGKMIETIRARFDPPFGTRGTKPSKRADKGSKEGKRATTDGSNESCVGDIKQSTRANASGTTTVTLEETEVKQRSSNRGR